MDSSREPGPPIAVGDKLALHHEDRWEPVTVVALTQPGRARVTFDGYLTTFDFNYAHSSQQDVSTAQLRSRVGVALHWQYRIVLRRVAILLVVAVCGMAGAWFYLNHEARVDDSTNSAPRDWQDGEAVAIAWEGEWYPGTIISRQGENQYLVSYDDYGDDWNEVVDASRLRAPTGSP